VFKLFANSYSRSLPGTGRLGSGDWEGPSSGPHERLGGQRRKSHSSRGANCLSFPDNVSDPRLHRSGVCHASSQLTLLCILCLGICQSHRRLGFWNKRGSESIVMNPIADSTAKCIAFRSEMSKVVVVWPKGVPSYVHLYTKSSRRHIAPDRTSINPTYQPSDRIILSRKQTCNYHSREKKTLTVFNKATQTQRPERLGYHSSVPLRTLP
jgi:hypothetical protein